MARRHHPQPFFIPFGQEAAHAAALKLGLSRLRPDYIAEVCGICNGRGEYDQSYTAGCGGGYYRSSGPCDYCERTGLTQRNRPAPGSVVNQVLVAASQQGGDLHG